MIDGLSIVDRLAIDASRAKDRIAELARLDATGQAVPLDELRQVMSAAGWTASDYDARVNLIKTYLRLRDAAAALPDMSAKVSAAEARVAKARDEFQRVTDTARQELTEAGARLNEVHATAAEVERQRAKVAEFRRENAEALRGV